MPRACRRIEDPDPQLSTSILRQAQDDGGVGVSAAFALPPALRQTGAMAASLGRNFTIVGAATLASRLTGFLRDMLVAAVLGAGAIADAYVAAFLIPNLFRRIIGEGAFNAAYVPIFTRRETEGGQESAARFAEAALSLLAGLGLLILLLGELAMPP